MAWTRVAAVDELAGGRTLRVDAGGRPILLSRIDGRIHAIDAICSHAGGRLEDGEIANGRVVCPIHGARFDLATGQASPETKFASDLRAYPVMVAGTDLLIDAPPRETADGVREAPPGASVAETGACPYSGAARGIDFNPTAPDQPECRFDLYRRVREELPIFRHPRA